MDNSMELTDARPADLPRILEIVAQAQRQMRLAGSDQWQDGYPAPDDLAADIAARRGLVLRQQGRTVAYAAVAFDGEPAYAQIDGEWLTDGPYAVVHRLAVADEMKRCGVARHFMLRIEAFARERGAASMRVDTNFDNRIMLRLLDGLGYRFCGEVSYRGGLRRAFEKPLPHTTTPSDDARK